VTKPEIILLSTAPDLGAGGIAVAMTGLMSGLTARGVLAGHLQTHRTDSRDKVGHAVRSAAQLPGLLRDVRRRGHTPVVMGHAGAIVSVTRMAAVLAVARAHGAATTLQLHSVTMGDWLTPPSRGWLLRQLCRPADLLTAATSTWADTFSAHGLGTVRVVPNAVPPDAEAALATPPAPPPPRRRGLVVGTMTRLVPGKGVDLLIRALATLPRHVSLQIAGDGPERAALTSLAETVGVADRVRFLGWITPDQKEAFLRGLQVFGLPSRFDSFGMGLIEAMARGVPVLALAEGAARDVVRDGLDGVLVRDTPAAVAAGLDLLTPAEPRRGMAVHAQDTVRARFTADAVAAVTISVAREAARRRRR